jgi:hypothetical protein
VLLVERQTDESIAGKFVAGDDVLEFAATREAPLVGDVELRLAALTYELHFDFVAGEVVTDGHGARLDRSAQGLLLGAVGAVAERLGSDAQSLPLHEQMLYAGLVTWQEAGGMALERSQTSLRPRVTDKSIGNDGVTCLERGLTYLTSFDYGDVTIVDRPVTADADECNGMCGPYCTELSPWRMWTLDCLEHDTCCGDTDDDTCWTPLNACGDEYLDARTDFLRGFDPFQGHCGG